ncbi:MAG: pentapeptide repeat-containing protein [Caulobacteraceae bacterium]
MKTTVRRRLFASRRTFFQLRRSATALLSRISLAVCMASFGVTLAATHAQAADDGEDTTRVLAFGGMCLNCELSGRKLPQAKFIGANFAGAAMVGSDLHGAAIFGSNFIGADLARADLHDATLFGSDFTNTRLHRGEPRRRARPRRQLHRRQPDPGRSRWREPAGLGAGPRERSRRSVRRRDAVRRKPHSGPLRAGQLQDRQSGRRQPRRRQSRRNRLHRRQLRPHQHCRERPLAGQGLDPDQIDQACGGPSTRLPAGLVAKPCKPGNVIVLHSTTPIHAGAPRYIVELAIP